MPQQLFPTMLTLCNFASGVLAIYTIFAQPFSIAVLCICFGLLFDLLDGWTARKLNAVSTFGKELDSLADIVTFGLAPAMFAYQLVLCELGQIGLGVAYLYSIGAVLRLARFNSTQSDLPTFIGLPVPGAAIGLLLSVAFMSPWLVALSTCLLAWFMISQVKFPHLKKIKVDEEEVHGIH
ncbi:CDP-diacylglycerol-serine O-phosphatidyltransferase [Solibacillus isronensis B3W22]|uniref:CDP-diacylglycerol--serine O-phosphatidyltransferase n=1 Tax=Solibacillus isronensis B3W22 TaxID=1224748 RepID=K1KQ04_9BACL|nr:CDP-diacylglycerol--serine O-phosphatidyltransferase [Solibacillus isronensis]AMO85378.1 CDP-diacylglycerol--serine O-phosphatidyltransferase [Solibacillus silvestris]EKB44596.1 CDP-diacylglycerol-serine O-phosphatidyltransferase [Solibacillus isronensis B3W22]